MKYRETELLAPKDVGASGTETIDLELSDIISSITVEFSAICPASITIQEVPAANIPKIELVDGSDVLFSLTGMQTHALDFFDTGRQYICGGSFVSNWGLLATLHLNFGRWLWDTQLALNPKKFRNPQLKITYDEDAAVASAEVNSLCVWANVFDEKAVTPVGFLMNKGLKDYTPTANAYEETDLPTDYPIRKLLIQMRVADLWWGGIISSLKIDEDNGKRIPLDMNAAQLEHWLHEFFGEYHDGIIADLNTGTGVDIYHTPTQGVKPRGDFYCSSDVLDNIPFGYRNKYCTTTMTGYTVMDIAGTMPHGCMCIPFGDQKDMADWYDVAGKSIKLKLKAGGSIGASETFRIATQQLRKY
jgi:hypothetical protein